MRKLILTKQKMSTIQPSRNRQFWCRYTPNTFTNSSAYGETILDIETDNKNSIKGISVLFFSEWQDRKSCGGSMTVEAAIVLPVFLFFLLNLLWIIEIYSLHSTLLSALREVGRELSVYAYAYDLIVDEEEDEGAEAFIEDVAFSYLYVKGRVESLAGKDYLDNSPLTYGKEGLVYVESSILQQGDIIDLTVTYQVSPFVNIVGFRPGRFYSRYYGRAWTGYKVGEEAENGEGAEYVYVTENAKVYHTDRECSHIRLSIAESGFGEIAELRNENGSRYLPCELCVTNGQGRLYITVSGERYHQEFSCSGLKRTVTRMLRSEAEKQCRMCSRCGR